MIHGKRNGFGRMRVAAYASAMVLFAFGAAAGCSTPGGGDEPASFAGSTGAGGDSRHQEDVGGQRDAGEGDGGEQDSGIPKPALAHVFIVPSGEGGTTTCARAPMPVTFDAAPASAKCSCLLYTSPSPRDS